MVAAESVSSTWPTSGGALQLLLHNVAAPAKSYRQPMKNNLKTSQSALGILVSVTEYLTSRKKVQTGIKALTT
jgi:hypothetical protein